MGFVVVVASGGCAGVAVTPGGGGAAVGAATAGNVVLVGEAELAVEPGESGELGDERGPRSSLSSRSRISMRRASAMSCPRRKPRLDSTVNTWLSKYLVHCDLTSYCRRGFRYLERVDFFPNSQCRNKGSGEKEC